MVYPAVLEGSYKHFFGAVYTYKGAYTQSVRFVTGEYSYMVFTRYNEKRHEHLGAGVEVRNRRTGKTIVVDCSERPRFYIFELQGVLPCDPETPVGKPTSFLQKSCWLSPYSHSIVAGGFDEMS